VDANPFEMLRPVSGGYAALPVEAAFNWRDCAAHAEPGEWYLVAFRSVHREAADEARLRAYDHRAYQEAQRSRGFVHYFRGPLTERRQCLSFCVWDAREHAREAARGPAHLEAMALLGEMYESYVLELFSLRREPGADTFAFEPFDRAHDSPVRVSVRG
jgi:hypothetical protein